MTGFGTATGRVGAAQVTVELRSVNHRFFNPSLKLPPALARWEGDVRELLRKRIARGHVSVSARLVREGDAEAVVNEEKFGAYVAQLRGLQERFGLGDAIDVATVLRMPDVMASDPADATPGTAEELLAVVTAALDGLMAMRDAEGARLADLFADRLAVLDAAIERVAVRAPERLVAERERLRDAVREISGGVDLEEQRLAQEIAILADRLDVTEEIDRFRAHVAAFRDTLARTGGEPAGKRLSFLLQEMVRETNTTGSKGRDTVILHEVVTIKEELERLAEQVENVE